MKKKMIMFLVAAILVVVDQITKILTRAFIPLGAKITVIPHLVGLTYIQNTGAAFSSFSGGTVLLSLISLVMSIVIIVVLCKNVFHHPFPQWCLTAILAGAVGNLIDRAFLGMVTDMIDTLFMNFAVYNFADICVTLGAIALAVYIVLFYDKCEGKQKKEAVDAADDHR